MVAKNWFRWASLDFWLTLASALALIALAFWVASRFITPAPPSRIVMTVGQEGGAYEGLAKDLQVLLAQSGIKLELRTTRGAREDLDLLTDPQAGVTLAVVQGGVATEADGNDLMSLAALYREPVWVFYRQGLKVDRLSSLKGRALSIGPAGSGVRTLSAQLLKANGVDDSNTRLADWPSDEAAQRLIDRKLDAIMVVGAPESNLIHRLMSQGGIRLMDFAQAEAYSHQFPFLARIVLPMGSFDLVRNIPDHDVTLVAPTANLVVRDDIHPALIDLLMEVATDVTSDASMLHREGEFPSPKGVDIPLSDDAARYMKNGPSFLHKYLPFWIAVWADRLLVLLIPIVAVLLPVMRLAPAAYAWRVKSRIYRWYGRLKQLEYELDLEGSQLDAAGAMARLDDIERGVSGIRTPLAFSENLYNLRAHIELVRHRLRKAA
ncbi:MAG: C4-dicarboxylate ABC transporter substrate-binding protein [Aquabacterium sp.]|uniref:TAXI family TRAP transporter solute-binding subunit n=1 Tax=Aquabacterium sp. TaxID=1872578 RepID=UPI00122A621A|nr:TAXI family TRAP transporter solute-binding subunit [Aquabacterium sp.]TAK97709.1 MAG: C4-dicarboxylate ABC transporter substrate-binding protein [Aquabacterium sp.]